MERIIKATENAFSPEANFINETIFHNANGYLGIRGALSEGTPEGCPSMRGIYLNGFYDIIPMPQAENLCHFVNEKETMLNVADTMTIRLFIDGEPLNMAKGKVLSHTRTLDMDRGITKRELTWENESGKQIELIETRMASFKEPSLFTMEYSARALNFNGQVEIKSYHITDVRNFSDPSDPRLASESRKNMYLLSLEKTDGCSVSVSETSVSGLRMCAAVSEETDFSGCGGNGIGDLLVGESEGVFSLRSDLKKNGRVTLRKYIVYTDSVRETDVKTAALSKMKAVRSHGLDFYYRAQEAFLKDFWNRSSLEVEGDDALNKATLFNMYVLLQSAPRDRFCSIAAKGLSGEGYEGHYFWDAETFVLPFFTMTQPEIAKAVLNYRYATLDKARENAALLGHKKGALFPWRTIGGRECSGYFVSGTAAYHIDADIAYAVVKYYQTTGDLDFIEEKGEEILLETARLFLDTGFFDRDGHFVINDVTGPDEYTCMVNNNYYTNCAAKFNLSWAVRLFRILENNGREKKVREKLKLSESELSEMEKASAAMLLLYDERLGINPQDDSFLQKPVWDFENTPAENYPLLLHYHPLNLYRYQVCKQADTVLSYFLYENEQSEEVMKRSFRYYEKITTHDSSLSTCIFSIVASRLGFKEEAYRYFGDSARMDLENLHHNSTFGAHTANMGGCYMAIVNGFARVRIDENGFSVSPELPDSWRKLTFHQVYRGSLLSLSADHEGTKVELLEGPDTEITVYGQKQRLSKGQCVYCKKV